MCVCVLCLWSFSILLIRLPQKSNFGPYLYVFHIPYQYVIRNDHAMGEGGSFKGFVRSRKKSFSTNAVTDAHVHINQSSSISVMQRPTQPTTFNLNSAGPPATPSPVAFANTFVTSDERGDDSF